MAIAYPGIGYLRGYNTNPDLVGKFAQGFDFGKGIKDEAEAPEAFAAYLDSLLGGGAATGQQAAPTDRLVAGSHIAAEGAADPMLTAYFQNTRRSESGGNDQAQNPNSTARGRYQVLEGTWNDYAQRYPQLGLTPDGRDDPNQQERFIRQFTADNAKALQGSGVPVNPGSLYAAHFLGSGAAPNVLKGDPNSPVSAYVDPGVIEANPQLANMSVAQFQQWAAEKGGNGQGGYQAPMAPQSGGTAAGGAAMPPRDVMLKLFANPQTRPIAIELAKSAAAGVAPKPVEINGRLVDPVSGKIIADFSEPPKGTDDQRELEQINRERSAAGQPQLTMEQFLSSKGGTGLSVTLPDGTVVQQGGGKLTEAQGKDLGFYTRGTEANTQLKTMDQQLTDLGGTMANLAPLGLGNYLRTPEFRQAKVAADQFLAAILRKDTGAAITDKEFELYGPMFLPIPGDDKDTIQQKRRMRDVAILAIKSGLGTAAAIGEANRIAVGGDETMTPRTSAPQGGGDFPEGTIIANDAGEQMVMRNGQWVPE